MEINRRNDWKYRKRITSNSKHLCIKKWLQLERMQECLTGRKKNSDLLLKIIIGELD